MQSGAVQMNASIILTDVGSNLGAINRSALIATDYIIVPLSTDLLSLQALRNLGPILNQWRQDWQRHKDNWRQADFPLPEGGMQPVGYVMQQHGLILTRPIRPYDKWVNRMPEEYARTCWAIPKGHIPRRQRKIENTPLPPSSTTEVWYQWPRKHASPFFTSTMPTEPLAVMPLLQMTHAETSRC